MFEYLLAASGRIIARECEAHDGMHVEGDVGPGFAITDELCACGRTGSVVLHTRPWQQQGYNLKDHRRADVAKLADAPDLGSGSRKGV